MADSKRNSTGGNRSGASTPKPSTVKGPTTTGPGDLDFSKVIGARLKLTTSPPTSESIEGTVFTADPITNILALNTSLTTVSSTPTSYMLIPVSRIQSFTILPTPPPASDAPTTPVALASALENGQQSIARIDVNALRAREAHAVMKLKERDAMIGKGVSKEAQEIFDSLSRTLPTRWHESSIIVNDNVVIKPPYTPDDCSSTKGFDNALVRVKRVLENERRKLAEKASVGINESNGQPATPATVAATANTAAVATTTTLSSTSATGTVRGGGATTPMVATPLPRKGG